MPIRHKYTLVCDDVRVENTNKLLVIGLYGPNVTVPMLPIAFPSLTFLQAFDFDRPGQVGFRASLQHLDSGQVVAQAMGVMGVMQAGHGVSTIRFTNIQFNQVGTYVFAVTINGMEEPITTTFEVVLNPPAHQMPNMPGIPSGGFVPPGVPQ